MIKDFLLYETDLLTILDNLSRKYFINVIIENIEEKMPAAIGYDTDRKAIVVNIPIFLDLIRDQKFSNFSDIDNYVGAKFLHEFHHSKIKSCKDDTWLLNICEDYYIDQILMKDNEALIKENLMFREIFSKRVEDDKLNIMLKDLDTIFLLCSTYSKDELEKIYGEDIMNYKKIFDSIKYENDICKALSELKKLLKVEKNEIVS